ncbi:MAG: acetyl-CoA carboxylase biotin carboxylase subunit, partial [Myxococcota bacterium]
MTRPIHKVLIANRGEIAARIIRTCHAVGLASVAVFSDADEDAPYVRLADQAVRLGPAPSRDSYLNIERILHAAALTQADAIHPGYGFLAENADFAQAIAEAGRIFIGPTPEAIRAMGSKIEAKRRVSAAGVPIVPGYNGDNQDTEVLIAKAKEIGFPLLLKASAGGGGKGMRIVHSADALDDAIPAARREAENAFGDGALMLERYVQNPRHIEFQILGDHHGHLVHLFERECSIQRRHQKIIEETPSPVLTPALRDTMGRAAVAVGQAIGYTNAGTVEFILSPEGDFYFLEVNTRLQVEHPITEQITGLDLVREQLRIAAGEPLGYTQASLSARGAALECRLYAEDPATGFLPSTGTLVDWHIPPQEGLRVDSGVQTGSEVTVHYDPMLAKLITWGQTRAEATARMVRTLRTMSAQGVQTNRQLLIDILIHPAYRDGQLTTHFIDDHFPNLQSTSPPPKAQVHRAALAATLAEFAERRSAHPSLPQLRPGFRNNYFNDQQQSWYIDDQHTLTIRYRAHNHTQLQTYQGDDPSASETVTLLAWEPPLLRFEDGQGMRHALRVIRDGDRAWVQ